MIQSCDVVVVNTYTSGCRLDITTKTVSESLTFVCSPYCLLLFCILFLMYCWRFFALVGYIYVLFVVLYVHQSSGESKDEGLEKYKVQVMTPMVNLGIVSRIYCLIFI